MLIVHALESAAGLPVLLAIISVALLTIVDRFRFPVTKMVFQRAEGWDMYVERYMRQQIAEDQSLAQKVEALKLSE